MLHQHSCIVFFLLLLTASLSAQERKQITTKSGSKYSMMEETYEVLKSDKNVKDGLYQSYRNNKPVMRGYYSNGQKDSIWEAYGATGAVLSRKHYTRGQPTGLWEFFTYRGEPEWSYDFATGKRAYQTTGTFSDTARTNYWSSAGAWGPDRADKPLIVLGSSGEWLQFLNRNLRYPDDAVNNEKMGDVVGIVVNEDGTIADYQLLQTAYPSLDSEAIRIMKLYPFEFIPAEKGGKKIRSQLPLTIRFKLEKG